MITSSSVPNRDWLYRRKSKNRVEISQEELDMLNEGGVDYVEVASETDDSEENL